MARSSLADLAAIKGVGRTKAAAIHAAFTLGARLRCTPAPNEDMDHPRKIYQMLGEEMRLLQQESSRVVLLNAKCRLIAVEEISRGSLDAVMAHPRDRDQIYLQPLHKLFYSALLASHLWRLLTSS